VTIRVLAKQRGYVMTRRTHELKLYENVGVEARLNGVLIKPIYLNDFDGVNG
jgi:hypothetical protein